LISFLVAVPKRNLPNVKLSVAKVILIVLLNAAMILNVSQTAIVTKQAAKEPALALISVPMDAHVQLPANTAINSE